jgi:L-methionine (R)-S-oxide reductase
MTNFNNVVRSLLTFGGDRAIALPRVLDEILAKFGADAASLHLLDPSRGTLILEAQRNLPPPVVDLTREIPLGKGIAGECAAKNEPVTTCNLQTDDSGVAKPGAKQTGLGGTICVPLRLDGKVVGTLGIGSRQERTYGEEETRALLSVARTLAEELCGARV